MQREIEYFINSYKIDPYELEKKYQLIKSKIHSEDQRKIELEKIIREEKNKVTYEFYNKIQDTIQKGTIVQDIKDTSYHIKLPDWPDELILPDFEAIKGDDFKHNDSVLVYIVPFNSKVKQIKKIICSRTHPMFLQRLIEYFVPEVKNNEIEIKNIVREPGSRAKVAIYKNPNNLNTKKETNIIGAILGKKLDRINKIRREINGEQIDLVQYSAETLEYIKNALSPARVVKVEHLADVNYRAFVSSYQLSLAIGPNAQNVRLAVRLTDFKIDIKVASE
jgi:N utilization substance protein A